MSVVSTPSISRSTIQITDPLPTYSDNNKVMANGITYQVLSNPNPQGKVMIRVTLRVGSMHEEDHEQGFAHFIEHAAFLGTKSYKGEDIRNYFQSIGLAAGADQNASTATMSTEYYITLPNDPDHIKKCLNILYEMIFEMKLSPEEVEKEKNAILDEKGRIVDWTIRSCRKQLRRLFPGQKFSERLPIGEESCIKNANSEGLRRFYEKWYRRTDLLGVFIVGDMDATMIEEMLKEEFEKAPRGESFDPVSPIPLQDVVSKISFIKSKAIKNPQFSMTQRVIQSGAFLLENCRERVLHQFLEILFKFRLNKVIQSSQEHNCRYQISRERSTEDPRTLLISFGMAAENIEKLKGAVRIVFRELRRLKLHGVQEKEFTDIARTLSSNYRLVGERLPDQQHAVLIDDLAYNFATFQTAIPEHYYKSAEIILSQISIDDVIQKIENFIHTRSSLFFVYLPDGNDSLTKKDILDIIDKEESTNDLPPWEVSREIIIPDPLRSTGRASAVEKHPSLEITSIKLENGVEIRIRPVTSDSRFFHLAGHHPFFREAALHDKKLSLMTTALAAFNSIGFAGISYPELSEFYNRSIIHGSFPSLTFEGVRAHSTPENREVLLKTLHQKLTSWDEVKGEEFAHQFEKKKQLRLHTLQLEQTDEQKVIYQFYDLITQGSPYYRPIAAEVYKEMEVNEARDIFLAHFPDPSQWKFSLVGHIGEIEEVLPLLCKYLGSLEKRETQGGTTFDYQIQLRETWDGTFRYYNLKKDRAISRILFEKKIKRVEFSSPEGNEKKPEGFLTLCAQAVLRTHLMNKIRREERLLYGISLGRKSIPLFAGETHRLTAKINYVEFNSTPDEGYINLLVSSVKDTIQALDLKTVEEILGGEKERMKIQKRDNDKTIAGWLARLKDSFSNQRSLDDLAEQLNDFEGDLDAVTPQEVLERIRKDFDPSCVIIQSHFPETHKPAKEKSEEGS